jgi:hypothetical protein
MMTTGLTIRFFLSIHSFVEVQHQLHSAVWDAPLKSDLLQWSTLLMLLVIVREFGRYVVHGDLASITKPSTAGVALGNYMGFGVLQCSVTCSHLAAVRTIPAFDSSLSRYSFTFTTTCG